MKQLIQDMNDLQEIIDKHQGLYSFNTWEMYNILYNEHKTMTKSYKKYIGTTKYDQKMQERYDYIICSVNQLVEDYIIS